MNMKNAQKVRNLQQNNIKRVNDYVFNVSDKIGEGYTAAVYRGQNCLTGKLVAIKVLNLRKVVNKIQQLLLQSQAKALNMIDHPNILRALHIMQTTNNYYFVTELFQQNLQQFLKKHGRFTQIQVIHFLHVMTNALYYLQKIGILHRDIKPSNIFVRNNDYVLGDFGFCHFINVPCQQKGFNVGSPLYMSPQSYKSSIYSCKSDIWSLGICIIELLLGYKPFTTLSYDQMIPYLCDKRFYRQFPISNALKQILDLIFQFDFQNRITPQNLINLLALNFPNYKIVNVVPSLNNLNLPLQSIQIRNRRSSSINSNKNLKFNIQNSRRLSPLPSPRNKQNQQNRPNMLNNQYNNRKGICSTQKKIGNYIQNPKINQNSNINTNVNIPCADPRLAILQNLSRLLFNDINLAQSSNKLKLLRILAIIQKNQFQNNLSILLTNFPSDPYFNYILHTTNYSNFLQISHYLCFLLQVVYNQLQMECLSHQHKNENQMEELNCLFNAIELWRKPKQKEIKALQSNNYINVQNILRNKCKSAGNIQQIIMSPH